MTRQEKLDRIMRGGMNGYDAPSYRPSGAPYMDDFTLGEESAAPGPFPWKTYAPLIVIGVIGFILSQR